MRRTLRAKVSPIILAVLSGWAVLVHAATPVDSHRLEDTTKSGRAVSLYRTGPESASVGILLSPSRRGLTPDIEQWAEALGHAGYRVILADPYGGRVYQSRVRARAAFAALAPAVVRAQAHVALRLLQAPGRKLVVMGWGRFGGQQALATALANASLVGGVVLYNDLHDLPDLPAKLSRLHAPLLGVYFRDEQKSARLEAFSNAMHAAHKIFYIHYYPGTVTRAVFAGPVGVRPDAVRLAWTETEGFLADMQRDCRRCVGLYHRPRRRYDRHHYRRR